MKNKTLSLSGEWTLHGKDKFGIPFTVSARVPGCVHTDLMRNGMLPDLFYRDSSKEALWIEEKDFTYTKTFSLECVEKNTYLEFDGLDTYAEIILNGVSLGTAFDMFLPYEYDVTEHLLVGENLLEVKFASPVNMVENRPKRKGCFTTERLYTRRVQCTYGWDWVDRFVTMGIFRDVRLAVRENNEIDNFYIVTKSINNYSAEMDLLVNVRDFADVGGRLGIEVCDPDGNTVYKKDRVIISPTVRARFHIPSPRLWYPNGYGEQPLYSLTVKTTSSEKSILFGIRTVSVLEIEDKEGSTEYDKCLWLKSQPHLKDIDFNTETASFTLLVNGIKIMCKGANWVPSEPFVSEESEEKITRLLTLGKEAGLNMLRVWGGGIFEKDCFYTECTRLGILVTQDFLMACGSYPEDEDWFIEALNREATAAALRLRNHTSLVWWTGDNENAVDGTDDTTDFPGYLSAERGIRPVLSELDPHRLFLPSSPYGGNKYSSSTRGTSHVSNFMGDIYQWVLSSDLGDYRERLSTYQARFIAEQPTMGMPFISSLRKFMTDGDIFGADTSISEFHTKHNPDLGEITLYSFIDNFTRKLFGEYKDGADRVKKMQLMQCEWLRFTFEMARRGKWFNSGILFWMYNDCWPSANGWSIVDYYANPKPAYYTFKRCAKEVIASFEKANSAYSLYISNDTLSRAFVKGRVYVYDFKNDVDLWTRDFTFTAEAEVASIALVVAREEVEQHLSENSILLADIEYDIGAGFDRAYFIDECYRDYSFLYSDPQIISDDGDYVTLTSDAFNPCALVDLPYVLSDNAFPIKKGEIRKIKILDKAV